MTEWKTTEIWKELQRVGEEVKVRDFKTKNQIYGVCLCVCASVHVSLSVSYICVSVHLYISVYTQICIYLYLSIRCTDRDIVIDINLTRC